MELDRVDAETELTVGSLIGLGVPLKLAYGNNLKDDKFVYLKLCYFGRELEIIKEVRRISANIYELFFNVELYY